MALRAMIQQWLSDSSNLELTQSILDTIDQLDLDKFQPLDQLLGLAVDANTPWATLRMVKFKCLLNLAISDLESAY